VDYEREGTAGKIDDTTGIHVYRVLQEAISNVARHSGVKTARVRLRRQDGALELEVEDRGKGLSASPSRRGLGLVAMRERAELLGGTLEILKPREGGTLVRLTVPAAAAAVSV
jgi:two-component system sensor histidine kinase UhpB